MFGKIIDKIPLIKRASQLADSWGLFARIMVAALLIGALAIGLMVSLFSLYFDQMAREEAEARLERSILVLAPVIDGASRNNMPQIARQILSDVVNEDGVICVDYRPSITTTPSQIVISLPKAGCQSFATDEHQFHEVTIRSQTKSDYRFYIDDRFFADERNLQLGTIALIATSALLVVFILLAFVFQRLILTPLANLQKAMSASRPSKPALAEVFRDDEIGAVSRTYNKLAAASRIYFARLDKSQNLLKDSESKFKDIAEISGDWFYEMDEALRFTYISDRFFEITKIAPADVIGKTRRQMMEGKDITATWQEHLSQLDAHQSFKNFEYAITSADGSDVMLRVTGKPLFDEDGTFMGYRGTGTDITEIIRDRQLLEEANRSFGDSVSYASSIQRCLLPQSQRLEEDFGEVSIVWQPKDVVGGDFYWVGQIGGARYLVFFDCTGHGVPGAFMTLITTSVLEKISAASPLALPAAQMLEQIHRGIVAQLGITQDKVGKDGLDCAVIKLTASEGQLEFAGASLDLFVSNEAGHVTRLRGDRYTLGYQLFSQARDFTNHNVPLAGNSFTLITDGMPTQIGEETKRVLGTRRMVEAMESAGANKPAKIVRSLAFLLKKWQGAQERRDDVTILSFRPYQ